MGKFESMGLGSRLRLASSNGWSPSTPEGGGESHDNGRTGPELLDLLSSGQPPAFASDSRDRIVFWNSGAAAVFGRTAEDALGRRCYEVTGGRDVFGNRFCYANCPVIATLREEGSVSGFEMSVHANGEGRVSTHMTVLRIPSVRPDLFTVVHILQPIESSGRLARALESLGASQPQQRDSDSWAPVAPPMPDVPPLTVREREILHQVASGLQNKEIAQRLDLSLATVRNHIHNILDKLDVHSKLEAVSLAFRSGWIKDDRAAGDE